MLKRPTNTGSSPSNAGCIPPCSYQGDRNALQPMGAVSYTHLDTVLAKEAGLELGINESIVVNDRMETSVPDIYAAGDAVQVKHYVTGDASLISLAGPANKQGRIIADNICGGDSRYLGSQGSSVIKVFEMTAATTGINETNAKKSGLEVDTVILSPMSHAGYYCLLYTSHRCRI